MPVGVQVDFDAIDRWIGVGDCAGAPAAALVPESAKAATVQISPATLRPRVRTADLGMSTGFLIAPR